MSIPYIERNPTNDEVLQMQLAFSTFCDGSGQERDGNGMTRAGWRDIERIFAEILGGKANENKHIFDVLVPDSDNEDIIYGISLKSKQISRASAIEDLEEEGRVHMEIANSPAKFWAELTKAGISESDFRSKNKASEIGQILLKTIDSWHLEAKTAFETQNPDKRLDLNKSVYITVSYSPFRDGIGRLYQAHSFPLTFPENIKWSYISDRCLRGMDPTDENKTLIDWYGLSGGQFKYYPKANTANYKSARFSLLEPEIISIVEKAKTYWPEKWPE
ncbi:hypothetical protein CL655_02315 [bacterium]|nr:hypothetical protein [bacterium]|tara:strand:- start:2287 stop:3111 length:825 start_codon:yes stop_codon:yes gene_type:complete